MTFIIDSRVPAKLKSMSWKLRSDSYSRSIDKLWKNIRKDVAGPSLVGEYTEVY